MMTEEEEEEEENNRILAHGNEEEEKNYETNGMNLKEILTQRLEGRVGGPTRRSAKGGWTPAEDDVLRRAVAIYKGKNWKKIGAFILIVSYIITFRHHHLLPKRKDRKKRKILNLNFFFWSYFLLLFVRLSSLSLKKILDMFTDIITIIIFWCSSLFLFISKRTKTKTHYL